MSAIKLAREFVKALLEEAQKDDKILGDEENVLLRAVLVTNDKRRLVWTFRLQGGRLESVTESVEDERSNSGIAVTMSIPTVESDEGTLNELLSKTISPLRAFARGSVKIRGDREYWKLLTEPAKRAGARVMPLLEKELPWPTFAEIHFVERNSSGWVPNLPRCQVCGEAFTFFSRPHHCRVCGRVVCGPCSPHSLSGNRTCSGCYIRIAVEKQQQKEVLQKPKRKDAEVLPNGNKSEQAKGPTLLFRTLKVIQDIETSDPIAIAQPTTDSEKLLRSHAVAALGETRELKKQLQHLRESKVPLRSFVRHGLILSLFYFMWKAAATSSFAWYVLIGFSALWKHSLVGLLLAQVDLREVFQSQMNNPSRYHMTALGAAVTIGIAQAILHRMFQRLLRIYSTSFTIIMCYQSVKVVCDRILKLSDLQKSRVFDRVDEFVAPLACDEVLDLKSVFVKFGQYLGARSDVVPAKWSSVLAKLQDDMPADNEQYVLDLLEKEGYDVSKDFDSFDLTPVASASIAQVHRAKFHGRLVAVKIQHENVEQMMRDDLIAFKRIMNFIVWLNPRFSLAKQLLNAWEMEMIKELDFHREGDNLQRVKQTCSAIHDVVVPELIKSTKRTLIMEWIQGFKITDTSLLDLYGVPREPLLKRAVQAYSRQIFVDGFFQADPHAGNMMVNVEESFSSNNHAQLVLLDFGMCVTLPEQVRMGYCQLLVALAHMSVYEMSKAIQLAGYENSQSQLNPERDLEYFLFLLRDTGTREEQREESKRFMAMRKQQRTEDESKLKSLQGGNGAQSKKKQPTAEDGGDGSDKNEVPEEGRYFKAMPDSLLFLMRTLGLLRGLCTTLNTPTSYLGNMVDYAKYALVLDSINNKMNEQEEQKKLHKRRSRLTNSELERKLMARIVTDERDDSISIEGGYQVCVIENGKVVADMAGGSLWDCDARHCTNQTLFPLCDLTKILPALSVIYRLRDGSLDVNAPILGPKAVGPTLRDVLSHSANGMQDAISSTMFGHHFKSRSYDKLLMKVGEFASTCALKTKKSEFHTQSFGYEVDLALRNSSAATTLEQDVKGRILQGNLARELVFGGIPSEYSSDKHQDECFAKISHGYAETVRMAMMAGGSGGGGNNPASPTTTVSLSNLGTLPGRVVPDASMVNDFELRRMNLPSFNGFGTARGMCFALSAAMSSVPMTVWNDVGEPQGNEENALFGQLEWGLGFVVHTPKRAGDPLILSHHSFGGSHVIFVPERKLVMCVLVSHLTVERDLTKRMVQEFCAHYGLPVPFVA